MFSIETLRNMSTYKSFHLGEDHYHSNNIEHFQVVETENNVFEIEAVVQDSNEYCAHLVIDSEQDKVLSSSCTCSYNYGGLCKHIVAIGLKYIQLQNTHNSQVHIAPLLQYQKSITNYINHSKISRQSKDMSNIQFILTDFNISMTNKNGIEKMFSMKIVQTDNLETTSLTLTKELVQQATGYYSILFEILHTKARHTSSGEYIIPQKYFDTIVTLLKEMNNVFLSHPEQKLLISDEIYKPELKLITLPERGIQIRYNDEKPIVGTYHAYIIKNNTLMMLPERIPLAFYKKLGKVMTVNSESVSGFMTKMLPVLKEWANIDDEELQGFRYITEKPDIYLYIKQGQTDHQLIITVYLNYPCDVSINALNWGTSTQSDAIILNNENEIIYIKRDMETEHHTYNYLRQMLWEYRSRTEFILTKSNDIHYFITEVLPYIPDEWKIQYDKSLSNLSIKRIPLNIDFRIELNENSNLLEFDLNIYCGKHKISLDKLRNYIKNQDKILGVNGEFFDIINKEQLIKFLDIIDSFQPDPGTPDKFKGNLYQVPHLNNIMEQISYVSYNTSDTYARLLNEMKTGRPLENVEIDKKFESTLRGYQKDGVNWMYFLRKYGFGGILADDMGLGKTLQTLVALKTGNFTKPSLVICPKTLVYNWYNEIQKFTPEFKVLIVEGSAQQRREQLNSVSNYDLVITSYSVIMQDSKKYENIEFEYCIIDEAQYIKNPKTKTAKAVKRVNSKYKLALTGTPIENNLFDLWSIFDFVMPNFLGTYTKFQMEYENPIIKNNDTNKLKELNQKIKPFVLRRTKKEMLKELPPKIEQTYYCDLTIEQMAIYTKILTQVKNNVYTAVNTKGFERSKIEILSALMRLRQICNHPGLLDEQYIDKKDVSGKMEMFAELLEECILGGHKLLVFSQFTKMLNILSRYLNNKKIKYLYLDGQSKNRQQIIDSFNNDDNIKVFLISLKAGGFGLNLTSADTVIIYDPWWNPMVEMQAADRAYRIGQTHTVNVYKLVSRGTIEEKIIKLQEKKKLLFDNLISENNDFMKKLSWEELKEILD